MQEVVDKTVESFFTEAFNFILRREEGDLKDAGIKDLTIVEIHVLDAVKKTSVNHDATMKEVADFLHISKGSLTVSSNRLITKGYLTKLTDVKDRRKKYLKLTSTGEKVCMIHEEWHDHLTRSAINEMSESELALLMKALDKVIKLMQPSEDGI